MNLGRDTHIQSIADGKEWGFPGGAVVNNLSAKAGDAGDEAVQSLGQEDPLEKKMATHSSILPGKTHGQRSLAGYSPCKHTHKKGADWNPSQEDLPDMVYRVWKK